MPCCTTTSCFGPLSVACACPCAGQQGEAANTVSHIITHRRPCITRHHQRITNYCRASRRSCKHSQSHNNSPKSMHHQTPSTHHHPLQGITLKLRYNRAGHLFEFPVLLSASPLDWPTLAGGRALGSGGIAGIACRWAWTMIVLCAIAAMCVHAWTMCMRVTSHLPASRRLPAAAAGLLGGWRAAGAPAAPRRGGTQVRRRWARGAVERIMRDGGRHEQRGGEGRTHLNPSGSRGCAGNRAQRVASLGAAPSCRRRCRTRAERQRQAEVIRAALALSRSAAELMLPVARRRLDREQRHGGLVVVLALYGEEAAVRAAAAAAPQRWRDVQAAAAAAAATVEQQQQQAAERQPAATAAAAAEASAAAQQEQQPAALPEPAAAAAAGGGGGGEDEVPPPVADVTVAVQYMVEGSKVAFHKGAPLGG